MNQPPVGAALKKMEPHRNNPPIRNAQNPKADKRGKGSSRAPIICGRKRMETASNMGMANRNIITEPCSVKTWLYMLGERNVLPGTANWMRIMSANRPPKIRKKKTRAVYQRPTMLLFTSDKYRHPVGDSQAFISRASWACLTSGEAAAERGWWSSVTGSPPLLAWYPPKI